MAFTTVEKVRSMFRSLTLDGAKSAITTAEVEAWIDEVSAIVCGCLDQFYDLDNVGAKSALILCRIETFKTAGIVDDVLNNYPDAKSKPMYDEKGSKLLKKYTPQWDEKNCQWCAPLAKLPDTKFLGLPSTTTKISIQNTTTAPTFKKGVDAW